MPSQHLGQLSSGFLKGAVCRSASVSRLASPLPVGSPSSLAVPPVPPAIGLLRTLRLPRNPRHLPQPLPCWLYSFGRHTQECRVDRSCRTEDKIDTRVLPSLWYVT